MAFEGIGFSAVLLHILLCSFFSFLSAEVESDILCLKSIKDSLEDPSDSLHTWVFGEKSMTDICASFQGVSCSSEDDFHGEVVSIQLDDKGLKGQFPGGIQKCSSLQTLNLSFNQLSGYIPSHIFSMLPSLHRLDLSINMFSGEIPVSIGNLTSLSTLDLSDNKFSGEIPASIGSLTGMRTLLLNNNEFTGEIPSQLGKLTLLIEFSVANNLLWGPVPLFSSNVSVGNMESYFNNSGLCGGPFEPCDRFHQSLMEGLIVGYAFSATSSILIVIYVSYLIPWTQLKKVRRKKPQQVSPYYSYIKRKWKMEEWKKKVQKLHLDLPEKRYHSLLQLNLQDKQCHEPQITEPGGSTYRMNFVELCDATDYFSPKNTIGVGKIGITYKARFPNSCFMAIKRLNDSQQCKRQFNLEIMILGRYKHRNIVPLLGFCEEEIERNERILVYQHMPNGRLSDFLSMTIGDAALNWPVRVGIALGLARGLCWLHHKVHIVHFSICSDCILLDQNFEPKISNFGEARFIHQNIGDDLDMMFHIENWSNNEIGFEKMDVYNFGIVLLELLEGKKINPMTDSFLNNDDFVVSFTDSLSRSPSGLLKAIDKSLMDKGFDDEIVTLLKIARCCVQPFLDQRPTMLEVFNKMSYIWETHELGNDFEMSKQSDIASATTSTDEIVEIECM